MNKFTFDMAAKSKNLISNSTLRLNKQTMMLKLMEIKNNEPRLTGKQTCNHLGYSVSTFKRYRDDIITDSPYSRNKYRKKILRKDNPKLIQQMKTLQKLKKLELIKRTT